jgi:hypothetical protein
MEYFTPRVVFPEKKSAPPLFMGCLIKKNPGRGFLPIFLSEKMKAVAIWGSVSFIPDPLIGRPRGAPLQILNLLFFIIHHSIFSLFPGKFPHSPETQGQGPGRFQC